MAVLGGRRKKKKKDRKRQPLSGSFSHQKIQEQAAGSAARTKASSSVLAKLSCNSEVEQKASPDVEDEEGGREGRASPPL